MGTKWYLILLLQLNILGIFENIKRLIDDHKFSSIEEVTTYEVEILLKYPNLNQETIEKIRELFNEQKSRISKSLSDMALQDANSNFTSRFSSIKQEFKKDHSGNDPSELLDLLSEWESQLQDLESDINKSNHSAQLESLLYCINELETRIKEKKLSKCESIVDTSIKLISGRETTTLQLDNRLKVLEKCRDTLTNFDTDKINELNTTLNELKARKIMVPCLGII